MFQCAHSSKFIETVSQCLDMDDVELLEYCKVQNADHRNITQVLDLYTCPNPNPNPNPNSNPNSNPNPDKPFLTKHFRAGENWTEALRELVATVDATNHC